MAAPAQLSSEVGLARARQQPRRRCREPRVARVPAVQQCAVALGIAATAGPSTALSLLTARPPARRRPAAPGQFLAAVLAGAGGADALVGYDCGTLVAAPPLTHATMSAHDPDGSLLCIHSVCVARPSGAEASRRACCARTCRTRRPRRRRWPRFGSSASRCSRRCTRPPALASSGRARSCTAPRRGPRWRSSWSERACNCAWDFSTSVAPARRQMAVRPPPPTARARARAQRRRRPRVRAACHRRLPADSLRFCLK